MLGFFEGVFCMMVFNLIIMLYIFFMGGARLVLLSNLPRHLRRKMYETIEDLSTYSTFRGAKSIDTMSQIELDDIVNEKPEVEDTVHED